MLPIHLGVFTAQKQDLKHEKFRSRLRRSDLGDISKSFVARESSVEIVKKGKKGKKRR